MDNERLFKLRWSVVDKSTGNSAKEGSGVYCGCSLAEAQEDAFNTILEDGFFDPETMVLVFAKDYEEASF